MNLVFITRKVDRADPLTGFVFTWLNQLAARIERLYVICQEKGDISGLLKNVEVYSLGKEQGHGKIYQSLKLFVLSFSLGKKSSGFFVHMHPIYAIVSWLPARVLRKKTILWYTHKAVDLKLRVAHALVDRVFTPSRESFRLPSKKVKIVGHGIDLGKFKNQNSKIKITNQNGKFKVLSIGRISPVKDYETLIKAIEILVYHKDAKDLEVKIYGKIGLPEHQGYWDSLVQFVHNADLEDQVKFEGEVAYEFVPELYSEADLFVNMSQTGSIDKTVLEAAASRVLVLTSNEAFVKPLQEISPILCFHPHRPEELAAKILALRNLPSDSKSRIRKDLQTWVEQEHNLDNLVKKIVQEYQ